MAALVRPLLAAAPRAHEFAGRGRDGGTDRMLPADEGPLAWFEPVASGAFVSARHGKNEGPRKPFLSTQGFISDRAVVALPPAANQENPSCGHRGARSGRRN